MPGSGMAPTVGEPTVEDAADVVGGRYELRGVIGRGGMAVVHRGFDRVLRREVAVKMMHGSVGDTAGRHRFAAETRVMAKLSDPHLVTLLDAGVDGTGAASRPWFVMELVDGPSLSSVLQDGPLTSSEAALVGEGVARGLAHVHAAGVVHRDVKPANVLLTATGATKLADFGVARAIGDGEALTQRGHTIGTAAYLAPEQVTGGPVSGASDVYALGLVLLEALTGQRAYRGTPQEAAFARLHHGPTIPVSLGAGWTRLLARMTASDPRDRPGAAEVAERLAALSAPPFTPRATAMAVVDDSPELVTGEQAARPRRRRSRTRLRAAACVAAVVLVAGVLAWAAHGTKGSPAALTAGTALATQTPSTRAPGVGGSDTAPRPHRSSAVAAVSDAPTVRPADHRSTARPVVRPRVRHHRHHRHHSGRHSDGHGHGHGHGHRHGKHERH